MRVRLDPKKRPVRVRTRRYPPKQRLWLEKYVDTLVDMDMFTTDVMPDWHAAPILVSKRGSKAQFRMAIDLRPVNAATLKKEAWPMPNLDAEMVDFAKSTCFAVLDFVSGYWQLPLHPDSYGACGLITPKGVFASKRVLPGLANATAYFQGSVEPLFKDIRDNMKAWLDDFNLHTENEKKLLQLLCQFFEVCRQCGLFLSARKCRFYAKELRWCGRITATGYTMDPSKAEGLKNLDSPRTAEELSQLVYCCRWMASAIPDFARTIDPLVKILERAYAQAGRRTTRAIKNVDLRTLSWGQVEERAWLTLQDKLHNAVELSYPDATKKICVFTDLRLRKLLVGSRHSDYARAAEPTDGKTAK